MGMPDGPQVQKDDSIFSAHDVKLGANTTGSAGFKDLRPAVAVQYSKEESKTNPAGTLTETETTAATASLALGKPATISGYKSFGTVEALPNGNSLMIQKGIGGSWSYGSSPEVTAAVRGDYIRQNGEGLSPYFVAMASAGGGKSPSMRLEAGACIKPDIPNIAAPNLCTGVYTDSTGKTGAQFRTEYKF